MKKMKKHPVLARRFDVSTALYRTKEDPEPALAFAAKGSYRIDLVHLLSAMLIAGSLALLCAASNAAEKKKTPSVKK